MYFLERVKGVVARATGGSPFYIQKRMRAALAGPGVARPTTRRLGGRSLTAREVIFHPFQGDRHRRRLGVFADLELRFVLADALPGRFFGLTAHAGGAERRSLWRRWSSKRLSKESEMPRIFGAALVVMGCA